MKRTTNRKSLVTLLTNVDWLSRTDLVNYWITIPELTNNEHESKSAEGFSPNS